MNTYYNIIDKIKEVISAEPFNNEVTFGDISKIDLKKQSLFPLAHVLVNNATILNNYTIFNVSIFFMDIVDISNEQTNDEFNGNNNLHDILNTQFALATRVKRVLQKADLYRDDFELNTDASCTPFTERFDNLLAGWEVTFDIGAKTEMSYC